VTWSTPGLGVAPEGAPIARDGWRSALLKHCGRIVLLAGAPVVAYTLVTAHRHPIQLVAYGLALGSGAVAGLLRSPGDRVRGALLIASCLFLGGVTAYVNGPTPAALLSLVSAPVLAGVAFGGRAGAFVLALSAASFLVCGAAGRLESTPRRARELVLFSTWPRMTAAYSVLTGLLVLLVASAIRRSETGLAEARAALARALAERQERKHVEEALRESEERLRLALDAAQMGTWEWNIETGAVAWTGQMEALAGVPPGGFRGTFEASLETLHPEDREQVEQAIAQALASERSEFRTESRVAGTDPVRWLEGKGRVYRNEAGRPILMRGTASDISERRGFEEALRRSEAELRALFASMEDVILVLDGQGRYVRVAPTNPSLLYRPPGELQGRRLHEVFPPEQADAFLCEIRRCLETRRTVRFEYVLSIRGSPVWFAATVSPMLHDQVVWVARDITESKRAGEFLRESEERWRRISEATFEGIGFSEKGLMIDVNEQLAHMLGYGTDELIGMPVGNCTAPEDRLRVSQSIQSGNTGAYEHRALRKDGSTFPVEVRAKALTLHGRTVRVTAIRDLSERARLEAELRRRDTLATMGTLVAGVAHEVRTPLFSVSATLDTLDAGVGTPEEQQELKDLLRSQVRRLSVLMQDLLDYGRPPELKLAVGGLRPAVERVLRNCQPQATQAGVRIEVQLPDDLPAVRVDSGRLQQVFENLVVNGVQHAPRGSTVSIRARAVEQPLGLACDVEDEGPGLAAADLERVFEPFFGHRKGGTGMGLAIAQRFVEAHGGTLSAGNRPGGGAVFTLFLPAAKVPEDALA